MSKIPFVDKPAVSKHIVDLRLSDEEPTDLQHSREFYMGQPLPQWYNPKKPFAFLESVELCSKCESSGGLCENHRRKDRTKQNTINIEVLKKWIQK